MKSFIRQLFGVDNRPRIIEADIEALQNNRNKEIIPSVEEPLSKTEAGDDNYGHAEGQTFGIEYEDSKGEITERYITVWGIKPGPSSLLLKAKCNLRNSTRSFRVDRIISIFDVNGEIFETNNFLHETFDIDLKHLANFKPEPLGQQFDRFSSVRHHIKTEAVLFAGLSLADGVFCQDEIDIGTNRLNRLLEKNNFLLDHNGYLKLQNYFSRIRPDMEEISYALEKLRTYSPERQISFLRSASDVINADQIVTDEERAMWLTFVKDLTGIETHSL